jgi:hypothetical protein
LWLPEILQQSPANALCVRPKHRSVFEQAAAPKGTSADHFVCNAIADAFSTLMMDNYQENRGRKPWLQS